MQLRTPRLVLRPLTRADLEEVLAIWLEPEVHAAIFSHRPATRELALDWLGRNEADPPRVFGIHIEEEAALAGYIGIQRLHETGEPELTYTLRTSAWGRGITAEAGAALLEHARRTLGLSRVMGVVLPGNARSRAVMRKLGLREAGMMMHAGMPHVRYERELTSS